MDDPRRRARPGPGHGLGRRAVLLLTRVLREARDTEAWRFTSPAEVIALWPRLSLHLGRRRAFWEFLLGRCKELGLVGAG